MNIDKQIKVGVSILNWNSYDDTAKVLSDLAAQKGVKISILVIDNGSRNRKEIEKLKENYPNISIIKNEKNFGVPYGFNQGLGYFFNKGFPYAMILNADARIEDPMFIQKLVESALQCNKCLIHPVTLFEHDRTVWFKYGHFNRLLGMPTHTGKGKPLPADERGLRSGGDFLTGCCLLIPKQVFDDIGMYDTNYFAYYEDLDFAFRAKRAGYNLVVDFGNPILHKRSASTTKNPKQFSRMQIYLWSRNSILFTRKQLGGMALLTLILGRIPLMLFWFTRASDKVRFLYDFLEGNIHGFTSSIRKEYEIKA